ncbi:hypothetical protein BDR07DRAFT_1411278 [Suillus spraguei]|nr:hypothetical protein BDR07DRAFT_1411278 [Suillus spraguei]
MSPLLSIRRLKTNIRPSLFYQNHTHYTATHSNFRTLVPLRSTLPCQARRHSLLPPLSPNRPAHPSPRTLNRFHIYTAHVDSRIDGESDAANSILDSPLKKHLRKSLERLVC